MWLVELGYSNFLYQYPRTCLEMLSHACVSKNTVFFFFRKEHQMLWEKCSFSLKAFLTWSTTHTTGSSDMWVNVSPRCIFFIKFKVVLFILVFILVPLLCQVNYSAPVVAVRFVGVQSDAAIQVQCKLNGKGIINDSPTDRYLGSVTFSLEVGA